MIDIGADLQRAFDEGYEKGKTDGAMIYGNEYNCIMTLFGNCSYAETGCGSCEVIEKVRKALDKYESKTENNSEKPNNCETCANGEGDIEACGYCRHGDLYETKTEPQTETKTETQNSNKNSNVILVSDGVSEMIRCAICNNPNQSHKGCDGACSYDENLYKRIMGAIDESRVDTPQMKGAER